MATRNAATASNSSHPARVTRCCAGSCGTLGIGLITRLMPPMVMAESATLNTGKYSAFGPNTETKSTT